MFETNQYMDYFPSLVIIVIVLVLLFVAMAAVKVKASIDSNKAERIRNDSKMLIVSPMDIVMDLIDYHDAKQNTKQANEFNGLLSKHLNNNDITYSNDCYPALSYGEWESYPSVVYMGIGDRTLNDSFAPSDNAIYIACNGTSAEEGRMLTPEDDSYPFSSNIEMSAGSIAVLCHEAGHVCQVNNNDPRLIIKEMLERIVRAIASPSAIIPISIALIGMFVVLETPPALCLLPLFIAALVKTGSSIVCCSYEKDATDKAKEFLHHEIGEMPGIGSALANARVLDYCYNTYRYEAMTWMLTCAFIVATGFALDSLTAILMAML